MKLLNQKLLPGQTIYEDVDTVEKAFDAIKDMKVRGAPAIAISALLGLAVEAYATHSSLQKGDTTWGTTPEEIASTLYRKLDYLGQSRPTAVNLHNAIRDAKQFIDNALKTMVTPESSKREALLESYISFAEGMLADDVRINESISKYGSEYILTNCRNGDEKIRMLTHCNTGALATTKYGTALGVMRFVHYKNSLERAYCTETRPYNQGARLTAYECTSEKMNTTLIVDSSVSYLMSQQKIHAVVVGADRVCRNGDTANKIGTYHIAVSAKKHGVPFFVAAPTTTFDLEMSEGSLIHIEERSPDEVTHNAQTGNRVVVDSPYLSVWNPSFDVTPAELITGIISEKGVIIPSSDGKYDLKLWLENNEKK